MRWTDSRRPRSAWEAIETLAHLDLAKAAQECRSPIGPTRTELEEAREKLAAMMRDVTPRRRGRLTVAQAEAMLGRRCTR